MNLLHFDPERVWHNVRVATTEDLLDRITVYRAGMEPEAVTLIEDELARRGVSPTQVAAHAEDRLRAAILLPDGTAQPCSFCNRPAVVQAWGWHHLWGRVPVFPRYFSYCSQHQPPAPSLDDPDAPETFWREQDKGEGSKRLSPSGEGELPPSSTRTKGEIGPGDCRAAP